MGGKWGQTPISHTNFAQALVVMKEFRYAKLVSVPTSRPRYKLFKGAPSQVLLLWQETVP